MSPITYCRQNGFKCDNVGGREWKCLMMAISQSKPELRMNGKLNSWTEEMCRDVLELARRIEPLLVFE
jgi:hypothetical protein